MRLIQTNWLIGISGIVLWPFIIVIRLDRKLLRHEYIHVMQIRRSQRKYGKMGVLFWYCSYLWEWAKAGFNYWKIKYEVEAFGNEENKDYIKANDPELWEDIKHLMTK
jgi:hypothetical protein